MAPMASTMERAKQSPRMYDDVPRPPTMITTPHNTTRLASSVGNPGASRSHIQAMPAATNGSAALITATFAALVSCRAGMKDTMPMVERDATSHPDFPMLTKWRRPPRAPVRKMKATMLPPPNSPRQKRIVQESKGRSRVKKGAVLHATAAAVTRASPKRCCDWGCIVEDDPKAPFQ